MFRCVLRGVLVLCLLAWGSVVWADPPLQVSQVVPTAYINDATGQTYAITIANPAGIASADNLSVSIDIPNSGFTLDSASLSNDRGLPMTVAGTDPVTVTFDTPFELPAGQSIQLSYRMASDCTVVEGDYPLTASAAYTGGSDTSNRIVTVLAGLLDVSLVGLLPDPFEVAVGDTVTLQATVTNTGSGTMYGAELTANWGSGFDSPALAAGGNVTPSLSGNSYTITLDQLASGASATFSYTLRVDNCDNLTLDAQATEPCSVDIYRADDSPLLVLKQPNLTIASGAAAIPYGGQGTMTLAITNDNAAGNRGPARDLLLNATIPADVEVVAGSLSADWSYSGGAFSYSGNGGLIAAGETVNLSFDLQAVDHCAGASGTVLFSPEYTNDCGDLFAPPIATASYAVTGTPTLTVSKSAVAAGGDNQRLFLGEQVTFTVTPVLTLPDKWEDNIVISDMLPDTFSAVSGSVTVGSLVQNGNALTWTLSPAQAAAAPSLTITASASSDPCHAGSFIGNTASASGTTSAGCTVNAADSLQLYLQSLVSGDFDESKQVAPPVGHSSYNVCDSTTPIEYQVDYAFPAGHGGNWSGSTLTDELNNGQLYVADSAQYSTNGTTWRSVPPGSVDSTGSLIFDLAFLATEFGDNAVAGRAVSFRYRTHPTADTLAPCTVSGTITSRSDLLLADASGGCDTGSAQHFYQAVFVPVSRAAMDVAIDLGSETVSKGQPLRPTITVDKITPWDDTGVIVTLHTANYAYLGSPSYGGILAGSNPTVTEGDGKVTFNFGNLVGGEAGSGTIAFDAVKDCTDNYVISADLAYGDGCSPAGSCSASASDSPQLGLQGDLVINVTPDQYQLTRDTLEWTVYVTNKGAGTAYDVRLVDSLKDVFNYASSTVDSVAATPTVEENGALADTITWQLGDLAPNEVRKVDIVVTTSGSGCSLTGANNISASYGWDDGGSYLPCATVNAGAVPLFTTPPSVMKLTNSVDANLELCSSGIIKLTLTNTGPTTNYNIDLTQHLGSTGLSYIAGTTTVNGVAAADPQVSGSDLQWTWSGGAGHLDQLLEMAPGASITVAFEVQTDENFNSATTITSRADWQEPCERGGADRSGLSVGAGFDVPRNRPDITLRALGRNETAGQLSYTDSVTAEQGDTVTWQVPIQNSGTTRARNMQLSPILPANMTFVRIFGHELDTTIEQAKYSIPDIYDGATSFYYITARVDGCAVDGPFEASVTWGCGDSSLTSPTDNHDDATLVTLPTLTAGNLSQAISSFTTEGGRVTITLRNSGAPLYNLTIADDLSNRFLIAGPISYSSGLIGPTVEPSLGDAGDTLSWTWAGPIAAGTHTISFDIRDANGNCSNAAALAPSLTASFDNSCGASTNVTANAQNFTPAKANLQISKTSEVQVVRAFETVSWTVTVENTGNAAAGNVEIVETVGSGFSNISVVSAADAPVVAGNILTWSGLNIAAGASYVIELQARAEVSGSHVNRAAATAYNSDASCEVVAEVADSAAVAVFDFTKNLDASQLSAFDGSGDSFGEVVTFIITTDFHDQDDYRNIVVRDTLPDGLEWLADNIDGATTAHHSGKNLEWRCADFNSGEGGGTRTIRYQARIVEEGAVAVGSVLTNQARASFDIDFGADGIFSFPATLPELQDTKSLTVKEPLVTLARSANPVSGSTVVASSDIQHTLTVTNSNGANAAPAYQLQLVDALPLGARNFDPTTGTINVNKGALPLVVNTDFTVAYAAGVLTFDFLPTANGTLQPGEVFTVVYGSRTDAGLGAGLTLVHDADIPVYYSQPLAVTGVVSYDNVTNRRVTHSSTERSYTKTLVAPADGKLAPGEEATFRISFDVPAHTSTYDISLVDTLPAGLAYVAGSSSGPGSGSGGSDLGHPEPTVSGQTLTWFAEAGNVDVVNGTAGDWTYTITYRAVALDAPGNVRGTSLVNAVRHDYNAFDGDSGSRTATSPASATVTLVEPALQVSKTVISSGPYQAGDTVTYRIAVSHAPGSDGTAYDVQIADTLEAGLNYERTVTNPDNPGVPVVVGQVLTYGDGGGIDLVVGDTFIFEVECTVDTAVEPATVLTNTAGISWTSSDGGGDNARLYGVVNDSADLTVQDPTALRKTMPIPPSGVVGEEFDYRLTVSVLEGTTPNLTVHDTLPEGLELVNIIGVAPGNGEMIYPLVSAPAIGDTGAISWRFSAVANPDNTLDDDDTLTIDYRVRINNLAVNQGGDVRTNSAYLEYGDGEGNNVSTAGSPQETTFTVKEPGLALSKTYPAGDYDAGDTVTYTLEVWHPATASPNDVRAFEVTVTDTVPAGMSYVPGSARIVNGPPGTVNDSNPLQWNFSEVDTSYDGDNRIALQYKVTLDDSVEPDQELTNSATLNWASYPIGDHARSGDDGPGGALNDYAAAVDSTLSVFNPINLIKTIPSGETGYAIGAPINFRLVMRLPEGTTQNLVIEDTLEAGLEFVSATISNGHAGMNYSLAAEPVAGATGTLRWDFGTVQNPANGDVSDDTVTIDYVVRLQDSADNRRGVVRENAAHIVYLDGGGNTTTTPDQIVSVTVTEPLPLLALDGPGTLDLGTAGDFVLRMVNNGDAAAYQPLIQIQLPDGLRATDPASLGPVQLAIAGGRSLTLTAGSDYSLAYDPATGIWSLSLVSDRAYLAVGETLRTSFQAILDLDAVNGTVLDPLLATVSDIYSLDTSAGLPSGVRHYAAALGSGTTGTADGAVGDDVTDDTPLTVQAPLLSASKAVSATVSAPGEQLHYTIVLTNSGAIDAVDVRFQDDLAAEFAAGSLTNVTSTSGTVTAEAEGGANGTGAIDIAGITIAAGGSVTVEWDVTLQAVLPNGTIVYNQGRAAVPNFTAPILTDSTNSSDNDGAETGNDPADGDDDDPTATLIGSAPALEVEKTVTDDDGELLVPGDTLTYNLTIRNSGNEHAVNAVLQDAIPSHTSYVAGSTTLNGAQQADNDGLSPLVSGLAIQTPGEAPGRLQVGAVATVSFQVRVMAETTGGTMISNQALLFADGEGSGTLEPEPSDDPDTGADDDPTELPVGDVAAIDAMKTVVDDNDGLLLAGETLSYQITISNSGVSDASGVVLNDPLPTGTSFVPGSLSLDSDGDGPLPAQSLSDPPGTDLQVAIGELAAGAKALVSFRVTVDGGTPAGTLIRNQGQVSSEGLPDEPTDADGIDANGDQPTDMVVGAAPLLQLNKEAADLNGGRVVAGDPLEYTLVISNRGSAAAANVTVSDAVPPAHTAYVAGSTTVQGRTVSDVTGPLSPLVAGIDVGTLAPGDAVTIRFRVTIGADTAPGTIIDNQAQYSAAGGLSGISDSGLDDGLEQGNDPSLPNDDDPTRVQLGGNPGTANVGGIVWLDGDHNRGYDSGEALQSGWTVELLQGGVQVASTLSAADGSYRFVGLPPGGGYEIRFRHTDSGVIWGQPVSSNGRVNGGTIADLTLLAGTTTLNQSLPLDPSGVVYDSVTRLPVAGATVEMTGPAGFDPALHLLPGQQNQVTGADGRYRFDLLPAAGAPAGRYRLVVTPPITYSPAFPSTIIEPQPGSLDPTGLGDPYQVVTGNEAPALTEDTTYYLTFDLAGGDPNVVNNHIPIDPVLADALLLTKTTSKKSVSVGDLVPYTLKLENRTAALITPFTLNDRIPAGFKYVKGSALVNGVQVDPEGQRPLRWNSLTLEPNGSMTISYLLVVGTGVAEGNIYKNTAQAMHGLTGTAISNRAVAAVQVVGEPIFSRSLIIGKVFNDINGDGMQQEGEAGIAGVRIASVSGVLVTTDHFGRYHLDDLQVEHFARGRNFILKVDPSTLPPGTTFTTENPRVVRLTQGLMQKINFGVKLPCRKPYCGPQAKVPEEASDPVQPSLTWRERLRSAAGQLVEIVQHLLVGTAHATEIEDSRPHRLQLDRQVFLDGSEQLNPLQQGTINDLMEQARLQPRLVIVLATSPASTEEARDLDSRRIAELKRILTERLGGAEAIGHLRIVAAEQAAPVDTARLPVRDDEPFEVDGEELEGDHPVPTVCAGTAAVAPLPRPSVRLTTDVLGVRPVLNVYLQNAPLAVDRVGQSNQGIFMIYSNYPRFINRWQIELYAPGADKPLAVLDGFASDLSRPIVWNLKDQRGKLVAPGKGYRYVLTVYDDSGRFDRTKPRSFDIQPDSFTQGRLEELPAEVGRRGSDQPQQLSYDQDHTAERHIPINGGKVTLYGEGISAGGRAAINGKAVNVDNNGRFVRELILPVGDHLFEVRIDDPRYGPCLYREWTSIADRDLFMVGMVDLTAGKTEFKGRMEPVEDVDEYDEELFLHGRAAFYLKGKIKGKYLITAQLDTGEEPLDKIFERMDQKDPRRIFRRLDPDQYYPVYGDDSVTTVDVDTQGKFYLKLNWDNSEMLWGNYQTGLNDTDLTSYNRSLYGARMALQSSQTTAFDDVRSKAVAFWSEAQTVASRDELRATGGSLYYLKHGDVVVGSEQLTVEVRDATSGRVISTYALEIGRDYEFDWLQGRVILTRPLSAVISSQKLITSSPLAGDQAYLVAEYEYDASSETVEHASYGLRASHWLFDQLQLGGTFINESRDTGKDHQAYGFDTTVKLNRNTWLNAEWGQSQRTRSGTFLSNDGGLSYAELPERDSSDRSQAWKVGLNVDFAPFSDLDLSTFYAFREKGYSTSGQEAVNDIRQFDLRLQGQIGGGFSLLTQYSLEDETDASKLSTAMLQVSKDLTDRARLSVEGRHQQIRDPEEENLEDTLAAVRLDYRLSERVRPYAIQQLTAQRNSATPANNRTTLGAALQVNPKLQLDIEGSTGNLGESARFGGSYQLYDDMTTYGNIEFQDSRYLGRTTTTTIGNKGRVTDKLDVYTENQVSYGTYESGVADVFGLSYAPVDHWILTFDYSKSSVDKRGERKTHRYLSSGTTGSAIPNSTLSFQGSEAVGLVERDVLTLGAAYESDTLNYRSKVQLRFDDGDEDQSQYVLTNYLDWTIRHNLSLLLGLDLSNTESDGSRVDDARFIEAKIGFAYRPISLDRLNLIGKYTYLEDLSPVGQDDGTNPDERSHIFSIEGLYDLNARWQIGEKLAYKRAEMRAERDRGKWFSSDTYLWVNRLNYHVVYQWDACAEYRMLWNTLADDMKKGFLIALYRHLGKNAKFGVGYNFTDFDDDLTNLDYEAKGPFVNLIMKW